SPGGPVLQSSVYVDRVPSGLVERLGGPAETATRTADHVHLLVLGHLVDPLTQCAERDVDGAGRVARVPLTVLADVEKVGVLRYLCRRHLGDVSSRHVCPLCRRMFVNTVEPQEPGCGPGASKTHA